MSEQWWENAPESDNRFNPAHPDYIPPFYINTDWDGSSNQVGSLHQRQQKFFQKYGMEYLKSPFYIASGGHSTKPTEPGLGNTVYPLVSGLIEPPEPEPQPEPEPEPEPGPEPEPEPEPEPPVYNWASYTEQMVNASNPSNYTRFGKTVSISGSYAIVGTDGEDTSANNSGAAYIFERDTDGSWNQFPTILKASNVGESDAFGTSVSISGNYAIVGAPNEDSDASGANQSDTVDSGAAYIFERDTNGSWNEIKILKASNAVTTGPPGTGYNIDFGSGTTTDTSTAGDGNQPGYWNTKDNNQISGAGTLTGTLLDINQQNSISYTLVTGTVITVTGGTDPITNDAFYYNSGTWKFTLTQVPNGTYDLWYYASSHGSINTGEFTITNSSGGSYTANNISSGSASVSNVEVTTGTLILEYSTGGGNYRGLAGLQLVPLSLPDGEKFGSSVSISGSYAIVGAINEDTSVVDSGAAYIFERDGNGSWNETQILKASNAGGSDLFGNSVAINEGYAIVGAKEEDTTADDNKGAAYIFERATDGSWNQVPTILKASNADDNDQFGYSVSISGSYAIVGAPYEDTSGTNSGSAYVFKRDTNGSWNQVPTILKASNAGETDQFGYSVSISGNYAIVGAYLERSDLNGDNDNLTQSGAVYVFKRDTDGSWNQNSSIIKASNPSAIDYFGYSVAINEGYAIVGAYNEDTNGSDTGAAYILESEIVL